MYVSTICTGTVIVDHNVCIRLHLEGLLAYFGRPSRLFSSSCILSASLFSSRLIQSFLSSLPASLFSSCSLLLLSNLIKSLLVLVLNCPRLLQDSPERQSYSVPASPTPPAQPPAVTPSSATTAAPPPGRPGVSGAQRRAQAIRLGALITELEKMLQNQSCSEKELRALDHQILHLATILKVPVCTSTHIYTHL